MSSGRCLALLAALVFASSAAFADAPPAASSGPAEATSAAPSALPPNAPIVLSPGVPAAPPKPVAHEEHPRERPVQRKWFGYQTLTADIAIVASAAVLLRSSDEGAHLPIFIGASALYLGIGPLLHLANGSGEAAGSLLVRVVALGAGSLGGALLISGFAGCTDATPCKLGMVDFAAIGAGVGTMVGAVVDAGWYAWKVTPATTAYVRPTFASMRDGGALGLAIAY